MLNKILFINMCFSYMAVHALIQYYTMLVVIPDISNLYNFVRVETDYIQLYFDDQSETCRICLATMILIYFIDL